MSLKSSETIKESRKWYLKYFAKIFSLCAPDTRYKHSFQENCYHRYHLSITMSRENMTSFRIKHYIFVIKRFKFQWSLDMRQESFRI